MSESDWLRPSLPDLEQFAAKYSEIDKLPTLDGTNALTTNFLSPCWEWGKDHVLALRAIAVQCDFPIDRWIVDLGAENAALYRELLNPNHKFFGLRIEQAEAWWEDCSDDEDPVPNRRRLGRHTLSAFLEPFLMSSYMPLLGEDCQLDFYNSRTLSFPMANVPYRWKARICGVFVLLSPELLSQVPVLVCVIDANLAETIGAMISMITQNIKHLGDGITEQEAFCLNLSRPGVYLNFSAALFSTEYLTAARSSTVLPLGVGLVVKQTRKFDLRVPNDRAEAGRHVRGIAQYLLSGKARVGRIQKYIRDTQDAEAQYADTS